MFSRFFSEKPSKNPSHGPKNDVVEPSITHLTTDKIKSVISNLQLAEPIFKKAGYLMTQLDVEFGNNPKLIPQFKRIEMVDDSKYDELLGQINDQQLIKFILISLNKSSRMLSLIDNEKFYFFGMEIDISSTPSIRTIFKRLED